MPIQLKDVNGNLVAMTNTQKTQFISDLGITPEAIGAVSAGVREISVSSSMTLDQSHANKTLTYSGNTDIVLTPIAGLGSFTVVQKAIGKVSIAGATGVTTTTLRDWRVAYTENSGVYSGSVGKFSAAYDSLLARQQEVPSIPLEYIGDRIVYRGVPLTWVSPDGLVGRYVADAGFVIRFQPVNRNAAVNSSTSQQMLMQAIIPAGVVTGQDRFVVTSTLSCPATFGTATARLNLSSEATTHQFFNNLTSTATGATLTATFNLAFNNLVNISGNYSAVTASAGTKRINPLADIVITLGIAFATTDSTKTASFDVTSANYPTLTIQPKCSVPDYSLASTYRAPDQQPFANDSFWNTPLPVGTLYENATDDKTALLITRNGGGYPNSNYPYINGWTSGGMPFIYLQENMPLANVSYTSRAPTGIWPFKGVSSGGGTFKYPMPPYALPTGQTSDKLCMLITPDRRYCIEVGSYSYDAATNTHSLGYANVIDLYGTGMTMLHTSQYSTTVIDPFFSSLQDSYRASGLPVMGGIIRKYDIERGVIDHMISMQLSQWQQLATVFKTVSAAGTQIVIRPLDQASNENAGTFKISYASLFPAGASIWHGGTQYTVDATGSTYDSASGNTTVNVTTTVTTTSTVTLAANTNAARKLLSFQWPATNCDGGADAYNGTQVGNAGTYRGLIRMGEVFAIPNNVDLNTLGITTAEGMMLATALQKYGGVNCDTTWNTTIVGFVDSELTGTPAAANMQTDVAKIIAALRVVTNFDRTMAQTPARIGNSPMPIVPLY